MFLLALMSASNNMRAQDVKMDPRRLEEVEYMALRMPNDTMYDGMREQMGVEEFDAMMLKIEQNNTERDDFLRNTPGITPRLFYLLDREYNIKHGPFFISIMTAISMRSDLSSEDIEKIASQMNRILDVAREGNQSHNEIFLIGGVGILKKYPSSENEKIAIRVMTRSDDPSWFAGKLAAAGTLASIGTEKSLSSMEGAQKWAESNPEIDDSWTKNIVNPMRSYNRDFKRRLEGIRRVKSSTAGVENSKPDHDGSGRKIATDRYPNTIYWLFALLGCLGAIAAGIGFRRSRIT
jgi:hypothetical protein